MDNHFSDWLITNKHLQGKHDQKTHGSWASGKTSIDVKQTPVTEEITARRLPGDPNYQRQRELDQEIREKRRSLVPFDKNLRDYEEQYHKEQEKIQRYFLNKVNKLNFDYQKIVQKIHELEKSENPEDQKAIEALRKKVLKIQKKVKKIDTETTNAKVVLMDKLHQFSGEYKQAKFDYENLQSAEAIALGIELAEKVRTKFIEVSGTAKSPNNLSNLLIVPWDEQGNIEPDAIFNTNDRMSGHGESRHGDNWNKGFYYAKTLITDNPLLTSRPVPIKLMAQSQDDGRAFASDDMIQMSRFSSNPITVLHELGHIIEGRDPLIRRLCQEFLDRRTINTDTGDFDPPEPLNKYGAGYRDDEFTRKDKFLSPYMGKNYYRTASEILSMGMQYMWERPYDLATKDPDMFNFIYAVTRLGGNNTQ